MKLLKIVEIHKNHVLSLMHIHEDKYPNVFQISPIIHEMCLFCSMYLTKDKKIKCVMNPLLWSICNESYAFTRPYVLNPLLWSLCYDIYAFIWVLIQFIWVWVWETLRIHQYVWQIISNSILYPIACKKGIHWCCW